MIKKYTYGTPFPTESVTEQFAASEGMPEFGVIHLQEGFSFTYKLRDEDVVYGLGEANPWHQQTRLPVYQQQFR